MSILSRRHIFRRIVLLMGALLFAIPFSLFGSQLASAAGELDANTEALALKYTSFSALKGCSVARLKDVISTSPSAPKSTSPSSWFGDDANNGKAYVYPSAVEKSCATIMSDLSSQIGITNYGNFLTDMGYAYNSSVPEYKWSGTSRERGAAFVAQLKKVQSDIDTLTQPMTYVIMMASLQGSCKGKDVGPYSGTFKTYADTSKRDGDYVFKKVTTTAGDRVYRYVASGMYSKTDVFGYEQQDFIVVSSLNYETGLLEQSCGTIANKVSENATVYAQTEAKGFCETSGPKYTEARLINACADGASHRSADLTYCPTQYASFASEGISSPGISGDRKEERDACYVGQGLPGAGQCIAIGYDTLTLVQACINGTENSDDPTYCGSIYPFPEGDRPDRNAEKRDACMAGQDLEVGPGIDEPEVLGVDCDVDPDAEGCGNGDSCVIEGIGWFICPIVTFLAGISDTVYKLIEGLLVTDVKVVDTQSGTYQAWQLMRTFANVGFVIVFLIIIFSQLTSVGISNYGVKKTLPRLILVAILVNLSFFACQLAVDVSNIVGGSLKTLLDNVDIYPNDIGSALDTGTPMSDLALGVLGGQLAIGALAGLGAAAYFGGIGLLIPLLIAAIVAVVMTIAILVARQALVILLVVLAPLAFLAILLPNTESLFKKWGKAFVAILLIYPAIALLFGASRVASGVLVSSVGDSFLAQLIGIAVMILPLFLVPKLLQGSLNAIPAIGNMAQKLSSGAVANSRKYGAKGMELAGNRLAAGNSRLAKFASGTLKGRGRMGRLRQTSARRAYEEPRMKDLQDQWSKEGLQTNDDALEAIVKQKGIKSFEGQAALAQIAKNGTVSNMKSLRAKAVKDGTVADYDRAINTSGTFASLKAKDYSLVFDDQPTADGKPTLYETKLAEAKATDMHTMTRAAITEAASKSVKFRETLKLALDDPEQKRFFDVNQAAEIAQLEADEAAGIKTPPKPI